MMADRHSGSYDGVVEEASVSVNGQKIDSKTAQQLSTSGKVAQNIRYDDRAIKALDAAGAKLAAEAAPKNENAEKKGEPSK